MKRLNVFTICVIVLFSVLALPDMLLAFTGLSGEVVDHFSGYPIKNAKVSIEELGVFGFTNQQGVYLLLLSPGVYKVKCEATDYSNLYILLQRIEEGKTTILDIDLLPKVLTPEQIEILEKEFEAERSPGTPIAPEGERIELALSRQGVYLPKKIKVLMSYGLVEELDLEEYVKGVIAGEMIESTTDIEALKAQAIAARTYTIFHLGKHNTDTQHIDVCINPSCCQNWKGGKYGDKVKLGVQETKDVVAVYRGNLIDALFFAHCRGITLDSEKAGFSKLPYCRTVPCLCGSGDSLINGHQAGMCQDGAASYAKQQGYSCFDILHHYYTDINLITLQPDSWFGLSLPEQPIFVQVSPEYGANLREEPTINSPIKDYTLKGAIGQIVYDEYQRFFVEDTDYKWWYVSFSSNQGWCWENALRIFWNEDLLNIENVVRFDNRDNTMKRQAAENTNNYFYLNTIRECPRNGYCFLKARQIVKVSDKKSGDCFIIYERYNYSLDLPDNPEDTKHLTFYLPEQPVISQDKSTLQSYGTFIQILSPITKAVTCQQGGNWCWPGSNLSRYWRILIEPTFAPQPWQAIYVISFGKEPIPAYLMKGNNWLGVNLPILKTAVCFPNIILPQSQTELPFSNVLPFETNAVVVSAISQSSEPTSLRFYAGDVVIALEQLNLRKTQEINNSNIIAALPKSRVLQISEHPDNGRFAYNHFWWRIGNGWCPEQYLAPLFTSQQTNLSSIMILSNFPGIMQVVNLITDDYLYFKSETKKDIAVPSDFSLISREVVSIPGNGQEPEYIIVFERHSKVSPSIFFTIDKPTILSQTQGRFTFLNNSDNLFSQTIVLLPEELNLVSSQIQNTQWWQNQITPLSLNNSSTVWCLLYVMRFTKNPNELLPNISLLNQEPPFLQIADKHIEFAESGITISSAPLNQNQPLGSSGKPIHIDASPY